MENLILLKQIVEKSLAKNGDKPLTISHLIKLIEREQEQLENIEEENLYPFDPSWDIG